MLWLQRTLVDEVIVAPLLPAACACLLHSITMCKSTDKRRISFMCTSAGKGAKEDARIPAAQHHRGVFPSRRALLHVSENDVVYSTACSLCSTDSSRSMNDWSLYVLQGMHLAADAAARAGSRVVAIHNCASWRAMFAHESMLIMRT